MTEAGIVAYGLAGNWCEECGRAKSLRLWPGVRTGCTTCDEVVTRHRCTGLPSDLAVGRSWTCPDCGSTWTAAERVEDCPDCCGGCGHRVTVKRLDYGEGDRIATAPRYEPQPYTPFRNRLPGGSR